MRTFCFALAAVTTTSLLSTFSAPGAQAQSIQSSSQVTTIPQGTLLRVVLQRALDSTTMDIGDKVRVRIADDDASALPKDCVLVGQVTEVVPATKTTPGLLDIHFGALERAGAARSISVDLAIGDQTKVDETADLAVTGKATQQRNTKIIGYGAGAGAVLGSLFKHRGRSLVRGGLLGALAGAVVADKTAQKTGKTVYSDVKLPAGTELTVTLNQPITIASTVVITSAPSQPSNGKPALTPFLGVYLQPTELQGAAVADYPGTRKLKLQLTNDGKVQGFAGVNTFRGTYKLAGTVGTGSPLTFSPLVSTRMAGPAATMTLESKYLKALAATTGYRIEGQKLTLLAGSKVIARFKKMAAQ